VMLRSSAVYRLAEVAASRLGAQRITAPVRALLPDDDGVGVELAGRRIRAGWVFDSRPPEPVPARGRTLWWQHFRGWQVRAGPGGFDAELPVLMDLAVPQPDREVAFGYVLPEDDTAALVEITGFGPRPWPEQRYERALRDYLAGTLDGAPYRIEAVERGVIPMTDAAMPPPAGRRVVRLGTAGGATRAATGYTFAAIQRQVAAVAESLLSGRDPLPPNSYRRRHRWLDGVLLHALASGAVTGADVFSQLFERNPPARVVDFLDGSTGIRDDLALMRTLPAAPLLRAALARGARLSAAG